MLRNNRVIQLKTGVLTDLSSALSDIHGATKVVNLVAGDYLYVGSDLPFNHRHFEVAVVNDQDVSMAVDVWNGEMWIPTLDVVDETQSAVGKTLSRSGIISFTIDPDRSSWTWDDTDEMDSSGLETLKIFGLYWARFKPSATLNALTELLYVGHKFSNDAAMVAEYPDLARSALKTSYKTGKTDWNEQHLLAAEYIIGDLRSIKNLLSSANQILNWENYEKAGVHRTAAIIFQALGEDYSRELINAMNSYKAALNVGNHQIDRNRNATLDEGERVETNVLMTR